MTKYSLTHANIMTISFIRV